MRVMSYEYNEAQAVHRPKQQKNRKSASLTSEKSYNSNWSMLYATGYGFSIFFPVGRPVWSASRGRGVGWWGGVGEPYIVLRRKLRSTKGRVFLSLLHIIYNCATYTKLTLIFLLTLALSSQLPIMEKSD